MYSSGCMIQSHGMKLKVLIGILSSLLLSESPTFPSMEFPFSSLALSLNISSPGRGDLPGFYAVLLILLAHGTGDHSWFPPRSELFQQKAEIGGLISKSKPCIHHISQVSQFLALLSLQGFKAVTNRGPKTVEVRCQSPMHRCQEVHAQVFTVMLINCVLRGRGGIFKTGAG